ncbi:transglycosylase SLT domain protein [Burkholderia thailandensis MSMB121]|nr:transglycosylase SLT domain protein [Burkholderia thailandensis MSMB121]
MTTTCPVRPPDPPRLDRQRRVGRLVLAALMLMRALSATAQDAPAPLVWTRVEPVQADGDPAHAQAAPAPPVAPPGPAGPQPAAHGARYDALIDAVARQFELDARLLHAMIETESRYDADARSPKGAVGLMQVMPETGRRFGFTDLADPDTNLRAGATYLKWLLKTFDDNLELAVAGYNAGEGAVMKAGRKIPPYRETQLYVRAVLKRYRSPGEAAAPIAAAATRAAISRADRHRPTPVTMLGKLASLLLSSPRASTSASP